MDGGSWVVRNDSFFVEGMWKDHNHTLDTSIVSTWEECAQTCEAWTINRDQPLQPCAMWTWTQNETVDGIHLAAGSCLLAQGGGPTLNTTSCGFVSGCQYGTVCNNSLPGMSRGPPPPPASKQVRNAIID